MSIVPLLGETYCSTKHNEVCQLLVKRLGNLMGDHDGYKQTQAIWP